MPILSKPSDHLNGVYGVRVIIDSRNDWADVEYRGKFGTFYDAIQTGFCADWELPEDAMMWLRSVQRKVYEILNH